MDYCWMEIAFVYWAVQLTVAGTQSIPKVNGVIVWPLEREIQYSIRNRWQCRTHAHAHDHLLHGMGSICDRPILVMGCRFSLLPPLLFIVRVCISALLCHSERVLIFSYRPIFVYSASTERLSFILPICTTFCECLIFVCRAMFWFHKSHKR